MLNKKNQRKNEVNWPWKFFKNGQRFDRERILDKRSFELLLLQINDINDKIDKVSEKLFGREAGYAQEAMSSINLKSSFPFDEFSEEESRRHGTDIIASVIDNEKSAGKISISVKNQKYWNSDFVTQLEKNIEKDDSQWGLLVTPSFPREALNQDIWTARDSKMRLFMIIKPEFIQVAYYALRQMIIFEKYLKNAAISHFEGRTKLKSSFPYSEKIFKDDGECCISGVRCNG